MTTKDAGSRMFEAIESGNHAALEDLWSDDVKVWHSGDAEDNRRRRALAIVRWFIDTTTTRSYEVLDRHEFDGGFVQQHLLRADGTNGEKVALRVCIVVTIDAAGRINRIDEYFDPADMAPLLKSTP